MEGRKVVETATMGKTIVKARITNLADLVNANAGILSPDRVRSIEVDNALVDTGAKIISMPKRLIQQLGLEHFDTRPATTAAGDVPCKLYHSVRLELQGRECISDVAEVADTCPVLIGYIPLELMSYIVDPIKRRVIPSPEHGGQQVIELY
jgi:predicted aspartyl protease